MLATDYQWIAGQEVDRLHHPRRREVERRPAVHRRRRGLHVQPDEAARRPLDLYALWTGAGLTSVTAAGNKVTMTFDERGRAVLLQLRQPGRHRAASTSVAPARRPPTRTPGPNPNPVGTGPFTVEPCTPQQHPVHRQPDLLAAGQAVHPEGRVPGLPGQRPGQPRPGQRQGAVGQPVHPEHQTVLPVQVAGQPHLVAAGRRTWQLVPEHRPVAPGDQQARGAAGASRYALDREQIAKIGEGGQQPAANQTGVVTPTFEKYFDQAALTAAGYDKPNPDKAKQLLAERRLLAVQPAQAQRHHGHRLHRLGRLARGHQAAARRRSASS